MHLLKLPPHTTYLFQPLDLGVKRTWEPIAGQFTRQQVRLIKKADFPKLLAKMWLSFKPECVVAGFEMAGVVPFNKKLFLGPLLGLQKCLLAVIPYRERKMVTQMMTPLQFADCLTDRLLVVDSPEGSLLTGSFADEVIQPGCSSPRSPSVVSPSVPVKSLSASVVSSSAPVISPSTQVVSPSTPVVSLCASHISLHTSRVSLCTSCVSFRTSCLPLCLRLYITLLIPTPLCH